MLELLLTILFSSLIIISFRLIEKFKVDEIEAIVWNYLFAGGLGLIVWKESLSVDVFIEKSWFVFAVLIGISFIITFFFLSRSTVKAGVALTAVASRMSVVIPVTAGFVLFNDKLTLQKISGIILALFSFYLIFRTKSKMKFSFKKAALPFFLFLGIGTNDTLMKYIQHNYITNDESLFLTVVFLAALLIGLVVLIYAIVFDGKKLSVIGFFSGAFLGALNFGTTYFFIRSMKYFETTILFPVVNVSIVALTTLFGVLLFREELSRVNWAGIFIAILAILLISTG